MVNASRRAGLDCGVISFDAWRPRAKAPGRLPPTSSPTDPRLMRLCHPAQLDTAERFALAFAPHLLHVHDAMLWEFACALRTRLGVAAMVTTHVVHGWQNRLRRLSGDTLSSSAERTAMSAADLVLAPSHAAAAALQALYPALGDRLEVVALAVEDSSAAQDAVHSQARACSAPELLYAARFADLNGTAELLAALPLLAERVPTLKFVIAGGVPENPRAERRWRDRFLAATDPELRASTTSLVGCLRRRSRAHTHRPPFCSRRAGSRRSA
jgi:glycosyltransferase involved in cell wall biosynthesis